MPGRLSCWTWPGERASRPWRIDECFGGSCYRLRPRLGRQVLAGFLPRIALSVLPFASHVTRLLEGPSGPKRILAQERFRSSSLKDFHLHMISSFLMGYLLRFVLRVGALATI